VYETLDKLFEKDVRMKRAFVFAGQGAQRVGMGQDVYQHSRAARTFLDGLPVDFDLKTLIFEDPDQRLNQTEMTQVATLCTSLMIVEALKDIGLHADVCAGLSLGEYSALTYAGVFDLDQVLPLVQARGRLMAEALPSGSSGMAAVLSGDVNAIQAVLDEASVQALGAVDVANLNSPKQTVISGQTEALNAAVVRLQALGMRVLPLNVSGAFHSRLLQPSGVKLEALLMALTLKPARLPVYMNVDGQVHSDVIPALTRQIYSPVQWIRTIHTMVADGVEHIVEIGPGKTLSKFVQAMHLGVRVDAIDSVADILTLKGELYGS
jgi:[acyl-carrier-protein] S-malonyltransferase